MNAGFRAAASTRAAGEASLAPTTKTRNRSAAKRPPAIVCDEIFASRSLRSGAFGRNAFVHPELRAREDGAKPSPPRDCEAEESAR